MLFDDDWGDCDTFLRQAAGTDYTVSTGMRASIIVGWYRRRPFNDKELSEMLGKYQPRRASYRNTAREILKTLGKPGQRVLEKWNKERSRDE